METLEGWQLIGLGGALWLGLLGLRKFINKRLEQETERVMGPLVARVYLNGIEIGSLPVAQHKALLAKARRTPMLYVRQARNTLQVGFCMLLAMFLCVPVVWLASLMLSLLGDPADVGSMVHGFMATLQQPSAEIVGEFVQKGIQFSILLSLILVGLGLFVSEGRFYGYRDVFKDEVAYQLRSELEAPAQGTVEVLYWAAGARSAQV